jgi:hypothetical protein
LSQNPKNNFLFHNHDNAKNRFLRRSSKNGMNVGMMRVAGHYYQSTNESLRLAIQAALMLLEEHETKRTALRQALKDGEESGRADYSLKGLMNELDSESAH